MRKTLTKRLFLCVDKLFYRAQNHPKQLPRLLKDLTYIKDIPYEGEGGCKLDILYREEEKDRLRPVVFEIHGGGFSAGDKSYRLYLAAEIAAETGAAVVNVNHPLGPEEPCPKPLQSLVRAFNWVIDHAGQYHFDTSRMLVTGDSSGAYYAAMLAMIPDHAALTEAYGMMHGRFSAALYLCGVYDIGASLKHRLPFGITTGVCVDISGRKPKDLASWQYFPLLSPLDYVTENHPPCMVIYSKKDFFAKGQAETFLAALRQCGVDCEESFSTKFTDNHGYVINTNSKAAKRSREAMVDYLRRFAE